MNPRYRLTVTLLEDAHFGSGTGAGNTDAYLDRDAQGHPVIRASHLKGVLRETAELYRDLKGCSDKQINALFGESANQRSYMVVTSLTVRDKQQSSKNPSLIWTSTARQIGSRCPQEDSLRVIEHCPAGLIFCGEIELTDAIYEPLLKKLVQRTDRFGGQRNRGNGLVQCSLERVDAVDLPSAKVHGQYTTKQRQLRLILEAIEPLLLPTSGHPGNLLSTEGFIRGQSLQGALVQFALQRQQIEAANQWLTGSISVGDALPLPMLVNTEVNPATAEIIPIPLSLGTPKPKGQDTQLPWWTKMGRHTDFIITHTNEALTKTCDGLNEKTTSKGEKLKRPGARQFIYRPNNTTAWQRYSPAIDVRMRVNLKKSYNDGKPSLFSHEEIAEKTQFMSDLFFDSDSSAKNFTEICQDIFTQDAWLRVGREGRPVRVVQAIWLDPDTKNQQTNIQDEWRLTLTSDTILRDEYLAYVIRPDINALLAAAGKSQDDYPSCQQWTINTNYCESTFVHGFNAVTGLRRVPAIALRRGSDFKITGKGSSQFATDLATQQAMGERTTEGYGRFIINFDPFAETLRPSAEETLPVNNNEESLLLLSKNMANKMNDELPSRSQLGWLRGMAEGGESPSKILNRIKESAKKQGGKAWSHFPITDIERDFNEESLLKTNEDSQRHYLITLVRWLTPRIKSHVVNNRSTKDDN